MGKAAVTFPKRKTWLRHILTGAFRTDKRETKTLISSGATPENRGRTRFFPDNDTQKNRSYVSMKKESVLRGKIHDIT